MPFIRDLPEFESSEEEEEYYEAGREDDDDDSDENVGYHDNENYYGVKDSFESLEDLLNPKEPDSPRFRR